MNADEYLTLCEPGIAQLRVLGSRFLGCALHLETFEESAARIEEERKKYHDASHGCWAACIGLSDRRVEKCSDAGEPKGTAGVPILNEIKKRELQNCLVIVTRYFGGTKLGTGGLVRAYSECAALALDAAKSEKKYIRVSLCVECSHDEQGLIYHIANRFQSSVEAEFHSELVRFEFSVSPLKKRELETAIIEEGRGKIRIIKDHE